MSVLKQGLLGAIALTTAAGAASAAVYTDTLGDNFDGNAHMDFTSIEVTNTATDITFKINVNGSIANPTDWGKYLVAIDTSNATGDFRDPKALAWNRNIRMADGADAFLGSWVDGGGGFQAFTFAGDAWTQNASGTPVLGTSSTQITTSLASLGLSEGQTFEFDVYATGGGDNDSANDAAANPNQSTTDWPGPYTTPTDSGFVYTAVVPEPASIGLIGVAGLALLGRRRRGA